MCVYVQMFICVCYKHEHEFVCVLWLYLSGGECANVGLDKATCIRVNVKCSQCTYVHVLLVWDHNTTFVEMCVKFVEVCLLQVEHKWLAWFSVLFGHK